MRKSRIETLAADGDKASVRLLAMLNNLNAYISATQLGITLSSLGLGWIGEPAVAALLDPALVWIGSVTGLAFLSSGPVLHTISFTIAFAFITFLHIVFGELAPKTAALELAERVSFAVALPLQIFYKIFNYPIRVLDWAGTKTVRLFGLHPSGEHGSSYTEDEIRQLINVSQQSGHLNEEERRLINQVFEFSETTVKAGDDTADRDRCRSRNMHAGGDRRGVSPAAAIRVYLFTAVRLTTWSDLFTAKRLTSLIRPKAFRLERIMQKPVYVVDTARLEDVLRQHAAREVSFRVCRR